MPLYAAVANLLSNNESLRHQRAADVCEALLAGWTLETPLARFQVAGMVQRTA